MNTERRSVQSNSVGGSGFTQLLLMVAVLGLLAAACSDSESTFAPLPIREGPRTETSYTVPHVQAFVDPVPEIDAELRRRIYLLPGIEDRPSITSILGTRALWLTADSEPTDLVATMREREFAHIHPDGSLHAVLPVDRALDATDAKWAELHPWVGRDDFWDGLVMLYTPQNADELEITWQLIVDSYNFVTGQELDAADFVAN